MWTKTLCFIFASISWAIAQDNEQLLTHTDFSLDQRSCVSLQAGKEYLRYTMSKIIYRYVDDFMETKPRIKFESQNLPNLKFNGTDANIYLKPLHELGSVHFVKSSLNDNKVKVDGVLPCKLSLAPRDLYDEDSTQDVMPGLDIIDYE